MQDTVVTEVAVVLVVEVPMEVLEALVRQVTMVVVQVHQDLTQRPVAQNQTDQV